MSSFAPARSVEGRWLLTRLVFVSGLAFASLGCTQTEATKRAEAAPPPSVTLPPAPEGSLNGHVLSTLQSYPIDGSYGYHWPKPGSDPWEGTTEALVYEGRQLTKGDAQKRSYCCGLTFEVYLKALRQATGAQVVPGVSAETLHELRLRFFGDSKESPERRKLVQFGLTSLDLGEPVPDLEDARAGDFVQFWRHKGSGHSAIFVNWTRNKQGEIVGLTYWSSQSTTQGIGYNSEKIGPQGVKRDEIYLARARWPLKPR